MSKSETSDHVGRELPKAKVEKDWKTYLFWIAPVAAALLAGYFIYSHSKKGPKIHIYFTDATRLEAGKSPVEYRGATIGQVDAIALTPDSKQVDVTASLVKSASGVARANSRFWIVKAQIGAAQIRGLGTLVSGDFITVEPGDGKPETHFQGLAQAPVEAKPGTLRIVLISERLGSIKPRSAIFYRGVQVGEIASFELGPESQTIQIKADIQKRYAPLVRMNSVFWSAGGIDVNLGLSGLDISAQSFKALVGGGVDFATPDTTQSPAIPGASFRLYEKPRDEWLTWSPRIELDQRSPPEQAQAAGGGGP